jgi:rod shape-determining protein MreD
MISEIDHRSRRDRFGTKINRDHSSTLAIGVPLLTILLGSLAPLLPLVPSGPVMPPLGYMTLIAWRLVRPGVLPVWIGFPLGAFDDLFSGQPFGFAILFWSLSMLAIEALEARFPWRGFWQDWTTASALLVTYLVFGAMLAPQAGGAIVLPLVLPQILLSIMLVPIIARMVAFFDRIRLLRVKVVR